MTLAVAESCTGGAIMARLVEEPGASEWFLGGIVAYHADEKHRLGIPQDELLQHGTMSAYASEQLAHKVRDRFGATQGMAITGNADEGEAWIALVGEGELDIHHIHASGTRKEILRSFRDAAIGLLQVP